MELEQLKDMWKEQAPEQAPRDVQPLLGKKSNTPIAKMKRHLIAELIAVVLLYGIIILYFFLGWKGRFVSVSILYLIIGTFFCIYYYKKFKLLNEIECMACQVKSNLSKQVATLDKYIRFYVLAGTAIIPIALLFFYWFEFTYIPRGKEVFFLQPSETISVARSVGQLALWIVISTFFFYYINKWYVKKLYGRHVDTLKEMLSQMEDDTIYS
ncbi:MAG TPA: hypothetical protein VFX73_00755 [Chitinophagaceae bacterium]|nr:hypothetical protein [Chitinophagaceae bacterium]